MNSSFRRYEILLPRRFNDGQPVPHALIGDTVLELRERFGAVSCETQVIQGYWVGENQTYQDELARLFIDVPDIPENRQFFVEYKEQLKTRFQQIEIWMTTYPLDVL